MRKKLLFLTALLILLVCTQCTKDNQEPEEDSLIIRYPDGHVVTQRMNDVYIIDKDEPDFTVLGKPRGNPGLEFSIHCDNGGASPVYFNSTGIGTNGIRMSLHHTTYTSYWNATSGIAYVTYVKRGFTDKAVIRFRDVMFTYKDNPDTLIVNGFLKATRANVLDDI